MRWLPLVLLLVLAPTAQAHGAPEVLDNEVTLLLDEGSDDQYVYDGFDLQFLYVREAYMGQQDGLIFRVAATQGPMQPGWGPYLIAFDIQYGETTHTLEYTSEDGTGWQGDHEVLEENIETIEGGIVEIDFQTFVPLTALGAEPDGTITGFTMQSYAKEDLIDAVPGGYYLPMAGTAIELTHWGVGVVATDDHLLDGPTDYANTTYEDGEIQVESQITVSGQHVILQIGDAPGWNVSTSVSAQEVAAGGSASFPLAVEEIGRAPLALTVSTDLGGREVLYLVDVDGAPVLSATPETAATEAQDVESPGLSLLILLAGLAGLLLAHRRLHLRR